ncbi:MAG: hypothetical protein KBD64_05210 [Gammaproteobacteria bacterium]|nr:hypothetical protein [Gammaproteobacteria bacterium]
MSTSPLDVYTLVLGGTGLNYKPVCEDKATRRNTLIAFFDMISGLRGFTIPRAARISLTSPALYYREPKAPVFTPVIKIDSASFDFTPVIKDFVDGPDGAGFLCPEIIAEGVVRILYQIDKGNKSKIVVAAHSRGAMQAFLIAHELNRIKIALLALAPTEESITLEKLKEIICASPDDKYFGTGTNLALKNILAYFENHFGTLSIEQILAKLKHSDFKFEIFAIDPVPGGDLHGLPTGWKDDRFKVLAPIVTNCTVILAEHERSRCFKAFVPERPKDMTAKVRVLALPGHHGTAMGCLGNQKFVEIADDYDTSSPQEFVFYLIAMLLQKHGIVINPELITERPEENYVKKWKDLKLRSLKNILTTFLTANCNQKKEILLKTLDHMYLHREGYAELAKMGYPTGIEGALSELVGYEPILSRIVHWGGSDDTLLCNIKDSVTPGSGVVNTYHARLKSKLVTARLLQEISSPKRTIIAPEEISSPDSSPTTDPSRAVSLLRELTQNALSVLECFKTGDITLSDEIKSYFETYSRNLVEFPLVITDQTQVKTNLHELVGILNSSEANDFHIPLTASASIDERDESVPTWQVTIRDLITVNINASIRDKLTYIRSTGTSARTIEELAVLQKHTETLEQKFTLLKDCKLISNEEIVKLAAEIMLTKAEIRAATAEATAAAEKARADLATAEATTAKAGAEAEISAANLKATTAEARAAAAVTAATTAEAEAAEQRATTAEANAAAAVTEVTAAKQKAEAAEKRAITAETSAAAAVTAAATARSAINRARIIHIKAIKIGCTIGLVVTAVVSGVLLIYFVAPAIMPVIIFAAISETIGLGTLAVIKGLVLTALIAAVTGLATKSISSCILHKTTNLSTDLKPAPTDLKPAPTDLKPAPTAPPPNAPTAKAE